MRVFRQSIRSGNATRGYPFEAEDAPAAFRGQIQLDPNRCTGDAACMRVCPSQAITVVHREDGWTWELNDARCVFCGLCEEACPTSAISHSREFELAVKHHLDMVTIADFIKKGAGSA